MDPVSEDLLLERLDDYVGLWEFAYCVRRELGLEDPEEVWRASTEVLRKLVGGRLFVAGYPTKDGGFEPWSLPQEEALSLLSARVLGSGLSWVPPFAYGAIVLIAGGDVRGEWTGWAWPTQPIEDVPSAFVASVLLAAGLVVACLMGAREVPGEE